MIFYRGRWYTINLLYRCSVSPFSCWCCLSPLITMGLVEERLLVRPCLLVGGLASPFSYVLVENGCLCQKVYPFRHHNFVGDRLPSWSHKLSPLFQLFDQSGKGFCGFIRTHHIHRIFFWVDLVYHTVVCEEMLDHGERWHLSKSCQIVHQWGQYV